VPVVNSSKIVKIHMNPQERGYEDARILVNWNETALPSNDQLGTTCGIYALHAAANVLGKYYATPPRKLKEPEHQTSIRAVAKKGLSAIGEINGVVDMQTLASRLGIATNILTFGDVDQLWSAIVTSSQAGDAIVFPYTAANSEGEVAGIKGREDFTHWGLVFGYALKNTGFRYVFMTTYGRYHMDSVDALYNSNTAIQDWSAQRWVKISLWSRDAQQDWSLWGNEWMADAEKERIILQMAKEAQKNKRGLAIGNEHKPIHILCDPTAPNIRIPDSLPGVVIKKAVQLTDMPYKANMAGKCVVVTNN
jgi:hypothetical protein